LKFNYLHVIVISNFLLLFGHPKLGHDMRLKAIYLIPYAGAFAALNDWNPNSERGRNRFSLFSFLQLYHLAWVIILTTLFCYSLHFLMPTHE